MTRQLLSMQLLSVLAIVSATLGAIAPAAQATTFRFRTLQERPGETVVIEDDAIENFRRQQRER